MKSYLFLLLIVSLVAWTSASGVNVSSVVSGTLEGGPTWTTAQTTAPETNGYSGGSFTYGGGGSSGGGGSLTVTEKVNNTITTEEPTPTPTEKTQPVQTVNHRDNTSITPAPELREGGTPMLFWAIVWIVFVVMGMVYFLIR